MSDGRSEFVQKTVKIGLVGLVLGAGIGGALLFRRPQPPEPTAAPRLRGAALVLRGSYDELVPSQSSGAADKATHASHDQAARVAAAPGAAERSVLSPPPLPATFERTPLPITRQEGRNIDAPIRDSRGPAADKAERTHRIHDGDTLSRLAARYLGDVRRGMEIYDVNQDRLTDPDVLPIGMEIKIPPKQRPTTETPQAVESPRPLVPVAGGLLRPRSEP